VLEAFRKQGLKVTYHIAETKGYQMLDFNVFKPDRFGHTYFFSEEDVKKTIQANVPVEFCPSSAMCTLQLDDFKKVPWNNFYNPSNEEHFICINTDDTLVFGSDITQECFQTCLAFHLTPNDLKNIYLSTIDFIFESDQQLKENLRKRIISFMDSK